MSDTGTWEGGELGPYHVGKRYSALGEGMARRQVLINVATEMCGQMINSPVGPAGKTSMTRCEYCN